jgi:hypothetical protein
MKHLNFAAVLLATGVLASCGNEKENKNAASPATNTELMQNYATPGNAAGDTTIPAANTTATAPAAPTAGGTAAGMNPPHGQPNHRCDIPVGAPLNSPPGKVPAAQGNPQQPGQPVVTQQVKPQAQPATTVTAPGMNPPHGQPGHRCDIAVGAPLSSAPAKKQETINPPPANPTTTEPVKAE